MWVRESARLIVIDSDERVLLLRVQEVGGNDWFREPGSPARDRVFWITPGGGIEPGESYEEAARRELFEETGLRDVELGDQIYYREKLLENRTGQVLCKESYFLVRLNGSVSISTDNQTELERRDLRGHHWWSLPELEGTTEVVYPEGFPGLIRRLLAESSCS